MAVNLSPYGGVGAQFLDNAGNVLTGGKIFTYAAGTTTNQVTYTTSAGDIPHSNPIILDASGRVPSGGEIWLTDGSAYKFILRDSNDVLIATYDNVTGINSNFIAFTNEQEIQTATAGQTVFNLTTTTYQPGTNSLSVFVDGVNQYGPGAQYAYLETDNDTVTFVTGLHVGAEVKFTTSQLNSSGLQANAFQVSYTPPFTGSVATNVGDKLAETVSVKDFGAVGNGVTNDTVAIQAALNSLSSGGTLLIPNGEYILTSGITVSNDNVVVECQGNATFKWTILGSGVNGITVNANNFEWSGGIAIGPSVASYVANERFISMVGTSTSVRKTGLKVFNVEIYNFGAYGVYAQFVDNIIIKNNYIHDCGYSGASFLSCNYGNFEANKVKNITPGTVGNMYGLSLTHDSTNYSSDPNAGTKLAANPFCWDWYVAGNHVEDINWEGIDCHGGYEICIIGNHIYATKQGIACSSSSGDASNYAGWNNSIINNVIDAANSDGTASGYENISYGINLNGGSVVLQEKVVCNGNVICGHGILGNVNSAAIQTSFNINGVITNNIIENWGGSGILLNSSSQMLIEGNTILQLGGAAAGAEFGIALNNITSEGSTFTITNNSMVSNGGTTGRNGFRAPLITTLPFFDGNDFTDATLSPYVVSSLFIVRLQDMPVLVATVNNAGTGETIDVSPMQRYPTFKLQITSSDALSTITNLTNPNVDQIVYLYSVGSTAWIFTRANAALSGGANFTASVYDSLVIQNVSLSAGVKWIEISRSANS